MAIENGPFEDVFPIKHGDFPASYVTLPKGKWNPTRNISETDLSILGKYSSARHVWCHPLGKPSHPCEPRKKPSYFPLYWLFNRDPCNGLL